MDDVLLLASYFYLTILQNYYKKKFKST